MFFTLLELSSKLFIYFGAAAILGGLFISALYRSNERFSLFNLQYVLIGCLLSFLGGTVNFFSKVGDIADNGLTGMIDPVFIEILSTSSVGESSDLRFNALILVVIGVALHAVYTRFSTKPDTLQLVLLTPAFLGALLLTLSFGLIGHSADGSFVIRGLLVIHVFLALLWMGSLIPLWRSCQLLDTPALKQLMHQFGQIAMTLVTILLICGVVVAAALIGNPEAIFTTRYGLLLVAKVLLIVIIMGIAAWHRLYLVPQLKDKSRMKYLQGSIVLEILTGFEILVATLLLSSIAGPESIS